MIVYAILPAIAMLRWINNDLAAEDETYRILIKNARQDQTWQRVGTDEKGNILFKTLDEKILAMLSSNGADLEIA